MVARMNPAFHPNILKIYSQVDPADKGGFRPLNLYRGSIINKEGTMGVRFLYNPSQIQVQHSLSADQIPTEVSDANPDLAATANPVSNAGTTSLSLLFDRTYEVWQDANHAGVLVDVAAFYALMKIIDDPSAVMASDIIKAPSPVPCYIYIGQNGKTLKQRALNQPLSYFGWVTNLTVTYTHWSMNMIPMRCAIEASINLMPNSAGGNSPNGDATGAAAAGSLSAPGASVVGGINDYRPPVTLPGPDGSNQSRTAGAPRPVGLGFG